MAIKAPCLNQASRWKHVRANLFEVPVVVDFEPIVR